MEKEGKTFCQTSASALLQALALGRSHSPTPLFTGSLPPKTSLSIIYSGSSPPSSLRPINNAASSRTSAFISISIHWKSSALLRAIIQIPYSSLIIMYKSSVLPLKSEARIHVSLITEFSTRPNTNVFIE